MKITDGLSWGVKLWRKRGRVELPRPCGSSGFRPGPVANRVALPLIWCPTRDSNSENLVSKTSAYAIPPAGLELGSRPGIRTRTELLLREARLPFRQSAKGWWGGKDSNLHGTSRPAGYSRVPYQTGVRPEGRQYRLSRDRKVVWVAGFEPAATRFQGADSDQAELHPVIGGRGGVAAFMVARMIARMRATSARMLFCLAACAALAGCGTQLPKEVNVPVPVPCVDEAQVPKRPALVTDADMRAAGATNGDRWYAAKSYQQLAEPYMADMEKIAAKCSRLRPP